MRQNLIDTYIQFVNIKIRPLALIAHFSLTNVLDLCLNFSPAVPDSYDYRRTLDQLAKTVPPSLVQDVHPSETPGSD